MKNGKEVTIQTPKNGKEAKEGREINRDRDKEIKETKETTITTSMSNISNVGRRLSLGEDGRMKELLKKIKAIGKELTEMNEKQDAYQQIAQEQMAELKKEIKEELGTMKRDAEKMKEEIKQLQMKNTEREEKQTVTQTRMKTLEILNQKLTSRQENLEMREMEYQLRL
ncbi:coiled-coil alpha-helical rod protein 1-like [Anolis sagrei]|uniref:coiled-coil alpha-helical rod protein 1-like n=1 Tax=Anolis sagrei TaxID=38937 RepID=UPI00352222D4